MHQELIDLCRKGDKKSQLKIYELYCDAMFNIAYRYLKNEEDAKDAIQESFLKTFLSLRNKDELLNFGAWLKRIVINQCIDRLKQKKLDTVSIEPDSLKIIDDNDWNFDTKISKEAIVKAIESLSEKYSLVLKLYLIEGYDHTEISEILTIAVKTSRTQLRRGKLQLQEILK